MLINYAVENYKSIKDKATLSMEAYTRDIRNKETLWEISKGLTLLPVASIYGQNASGKSTLWDSMRHARELIVQPGLLKTHREESKGFLFDNVSINLPTVFSFDYINDGKRFFYEFAVFEGKVVKETLNCEKKLLFDRKDDSTLKIGSSVPNDEKKKIELIMEATKENYLLLSKCSEFKVRSVGEAYGWFEDRLRFIKAQKPIEERPGVVSKIEEALKDHRSEIIDMINRADFGISDIFFEEAMFLDGRIGRNIYKEVLIEHNIKTAVGDKRQTLKLSEESDGTKKMILLVIAWIDAVKNGRVLVIDEMESSLHPHLVDFLIEYITKKDVNVNGAQLIFTTHDATTAKRNMFRRDQVWFTSRDPGEGATSLYSWLDYDVRSDLEFTENYLAGRFGAIPHVKKIGDL